MATTVGRVEIEVDADGNQIVRQLRQIGRRAGTAAGQEMGERLQWELESRISKFDKSGAFVKFRDSWKLVSNDIDKVATSMRGLERDTNRAEGGFDRLFKRMARTHAFKTVVAWTALILSSFQQLAVLGSAAGGALFVLGGALTGLVGGLVVAATAFGGLTRSLEDLPEHLRPAAEAFQNLGKAFGTLQEALTTAAFQNSAGVWQSLTATIQGLTPALQTVATIVGQLVADFAAAVAPGTELFTKIETAIVNMGPIFDRFVRSLGLLGDALLDAFNNPRLQKSIQQMFDWTDKLFTRFDDFVNSEGFTEWLDNTERIMGDLGRLLDATGEMLNNLVTPESVERTSAFLANLTAAMPFFQSLLETFGELDVFGLVAELLATVGNALRPFLEFLEPIASIIRDVLIIAFNNLAISLQMLSVLLLPARLLWEALAVVFEKAVEWMTPVWDALNQVGDAIQNTANKVFEALTPAFEAITDAIFAMLPSPEEFERFLTEEMIPAIESFGDWIITYVVPAIEDFAYWLESEGVPAMRDFWTFLSTKLIPFLTNLWEAADKAVQGFEDFVGGIATAINILTLPIQGAISLFDRLWTAASRALGLAQTVPGGGGGGRPRTAFASGGVLFNRTHVTAGEAGPEAIVPLRRNLTQVDPSVRWLSAVAQGKYPQMASGGIVGGGRQVIFQSGAIVVQGALNPEADAIAVLNRAAERLA